MAETNRQSFEVVRRGYDMEQVDKFLVHQAEAWRKELHRAQTRISELESKVQSLSQLEPQLEQARQQEEALALTLQSATQAKDELLTKAEQETSELRTQAEIEAEEMRALAADEAESVRTEATSEADRIVSEAKDKATSLVESAEKEADDARHESRMRTDELMLAQEEQLQQRRAELDQEFETAVGRYELVEQSLKDKVTELNSMREALVTGLEAIATGGLSALEDVQDELAAVGISQGDDSAVRHLVGGGTKPESYLPEDTEKSA